MSKVPLQKLFFKELPICIMGKQIAKNKRANKLQSQKKYGKA